MSLKKCDECGKEISTVAKTCPHCGAPSKSKKIETQITGGCALVVLAVILFSCLNGSGHQTVNPTVEDKERAAKFGISIDVYMAAKAAEPDAYAACDTQAVRQAKYDTKSDLATPEGWSTDGKTISLTGYELQFQNGFGAYEHVTYNCTYDIKKKTVTQLNIF